MENTTNMQPENTNPQEPVQPKANDYRYINIAASLERGLTLADISDQAKSLGLPVHGPTVEELMQNDPRFKDREDLAKKYVEYSDLQTRLYHEQQFDPFERTGIVTTNNDLGRLMSAQWGIDVSNKEYKGPQLRGSEIGIETGKGGTLQTRMPDEAASEKNIYIDKYGKVQPLYKADLEANHLYSYQDADGKIFWKEANDDEYIPSDIIRGQFDRKMQSDNLMEVVARNFWYGLGPLMVKGVGMGAGILDAVSDLITADDTRGNKDSALYRTNIRLQNWANSHMAQNLDEKLGLFDSWTSFMASVSNGVGQMAGMIGTGYATAGIGAGLRAAGVALPTLGARAGIVGALEKIGTNKKVADILGDIIAPDMATATVLFMGDLQSGSMFQQILMDAGMDYNKATKYAMPFMLATHMSEALIPYDETLGKKLFDQYAGKFAGKNITKDEAKKLVKEVLGDKAMAKAITDVPDAVKVSLVKSAANKIADQRLNIIDKLNGDKIVRVLLGGTVEGLEEELEGVMHSWISMYQNGMLALWAEKFNNTFAGIDVVPNDENGLWSDGDGKIRGSIGFPYKMIDKNNPSGYKLLTEEQAQEFINKKQFAKDIIGGKKILSEDVNIEEGISAFISTSLVSMVMPGPKSTKQKAIIELADKIQKSPQLRQQLENHLMQLVKDGKLGNNYQTSKGEIIKDGKVGSSQAGDYVNTLLQDVDRYVEIIDRYKLNSKEVQFAINRNKTLSQMAVVKAEEIDNIDALLGSLAEGTKVQIGTYKDMDADKLSKIREAKYKELQDIITPKDEDMEDTNGMPVKSKRSKKYTELWIETRFLDEAINLTAEATAKRQINLPDTDPGYKAELEKKKSEIIANLTENIQKGRPDKNQTLLKGIADNISATLLEYNHENQDSFVNILRKNKDQMILEHNESVTKKRDITERLGEITTHINLVKQELETNKDLEPGKRLDNILWSSLDPLAKLIKSVAEDISSSSIEGLSEDDVKMAVKLSLEIQQALVDEIKAVDKNHINYTFFGNISDAVSDIVDAKRQKTVTRFTDFGDEYQTKKAELFNRSIDNIYVKDKDGKPVSIIAFINEYNQDNKEIGNPTYVLAFAQAIRQKLESIDYFIDVNTRIFQDDVEAKEETKEHSQIYYDYERLSDKNGRDALKAKVNDLINKSRSIEQKAYASEESRLIEMTKYLMTKMGVDMEFFSYLFGQSDASKMFGAEFVNAYIRLTEVLKKAKLLGVDESGVDNDEMYIAADRMFAEYSKTRNTDEETKNTRALYLVTVVAEVYKALVEVNDSLAGKTGEFAKKFAGEKMNYGYLREYTSGQMIDKTSPKIDGTFSPYNYRNGKAYHGLNVQELSDRISQESKKDNIAKNVLEDQASFFKYYTLTKLQTLQRSGKKGEGDAYSYSELLEAIRDSMKDMYDQNNRTASVNAQIGGQYNIQSNLNPSTMEQIDMILHLLNFSMNPDNSYIDEASTGKLTWPNTIIARGFAGVGKSSQVPLHFIKARYKLTNKKQRITIVVPHEEYRNNYLELQKNLETELEKGEFNIISYDEFKKDGVGEMDMVFLEEASNVQNTSEDGKKTENEIIKEQIESTVKKNNKVVFIAIGDSLQISPGSDMNFNSPYFLQRGEKTNPMMMMHRMGLVLFSDMINSIRNSTDNFDLLPDSQYAMVGDKRIGIYNQKSEEEVVKEFVEYVGKYAPNKKEAILVVYTEEDRNKVIKNHPSLEKFKENIKVIEKPVKHTDETKDLWISGISSKRVYIAVDVLDFENDHIYNDTARKNNRQVYAQQVLNTVMGRVTGDEGYISWVKKDKESQRVEKLIPFEKFGMEEAKLRFEETLAFLEQVLGKKSGYTAKVKKEETSYGEKSMRRDSGMIAENDEVAKVVNVVKDKMQRDEQTATKKTSVSDKIWEESKKNKQVVKNKEQINQDKIDLAWKLTHYFDPLSSTFIGNIGAGNELILTVNGVNYKVTFAIPPQTVNGKYVLIENGSWSIEGIKEDGTKVKLTIDVLYDHLTKITTPQGIENVDNSNVISSEKLQEKIEIAAYHNLLHNIFKWSIRPNEYDFNDLVELVNKYNKVVTEKEKVINNPENWIRATMRAMVMNPELSGIINAETAVLMPFIEVNEIVGHPFILNVVGYTIDETTNAITPIVDMYDLTFNKTDISKIPNLHKKNAAYIVMLGKLGIKVNQVRVVNMQYRGSDSINSIKEIVTIDENQITEQMDKAAVILEMVNDVPLATLEELYTVYRESPDALASSDENTNLAVGNYVVDMKGNDYTISSIGMKMTKNGEEFQIGLSKGKTVKYVSFDDLNKNYQRLKTYYAFDKFITSANMVIADNVDYSTSTALITPVNETMEKGMWDENDFWNHSTNRWLVIKSVVTKYLNGITLEKEYLKEANVYEVVAGKYSASPTVMKHVVVNKLSNADVENLFARTEKEINKALKKMNPKAKAITKEEFVRHHTIVSSDTQVEYDFKDQKTGRAIHLFDVPELKAKAESYINGDVEYTVDQLQEMFSNAFSSDNDPLKRFTLVLANIKRLKALRLLVQNQKQGITTETEIQTIIPGHPLKEKAVNGSNTISLVQFEENLKKNDCKVVDDGVHYQTVNKRARILIKVKRDDLTEPVVVFGDAAVVKKDDVTVLQKRFKNELDELVKGASIDEALKNYEKLLSEDAKDKKKINDAYASIMLLLEQTEAYKFLKTNNAYLRANESTYSKMLVYRNNGHIDLKYSGYFGQDKETRQMFEGKMLSLRRALEIMFKDIEQSHKTQSNQLFFHSPYMAGENIMNKENIIVDYANVSHPSFLLTIPNVEEYKSIAKQEVEELATQEGYNQSIDDKISELRNRLPENQSNTRTDATRIILDYLADVLGIEKYKGDMSKGDYIQWFRDVGNIGYSVLDLLNSPKRAFDVITEWNKSQQQTFVTPNEPQPKKKGTRETKETFETGNPTQATGNKNESTEEPVESWDVSTENENQNIPKQSDLDKADNKEDEYDNLNLSIKDLNRPINDFIGISVVIDQLKAIIGENNLEKVLNENSFLSYERIVNGEYSDLFYARLIYGMMQFAVTEGRIHPFAARHESAHYIVDFLLKEEERSKVLQEAKEILARINRTIADQYTDKEAHELIADLFQDKSYKQVLKRSSRLKQFIDWIRRKLFPSVRRNYDSLEALLYGADRGEFVNHGIQNMKHFDKSYNMAVDNMFTTTANSNRVINIFGSVDNIESIKQDLIASMFMTSFSNYQKNMLENPKDAYRILMEMKEHFRLLGQKNEDEAKAILNKKHNVIVRDPATGKMSLKEVRLASFVADNANKREATEKYYAIKDARNGNSQHYERNEEFVRLYEMWHLNNDRTFLTLMQSVLKTIDLDQLRKAKDQNADFTSYSTRMFDSVRFTEANPVGTRNQTLNLILNTIPLYKEDDNGGWEKYEGSKRKIEYCNAGKLGFLLLRAAIAVRGSGKYFKDESFYHAWFNELRRMKNKFDRNDEHRRLIQSFLFEIGNDAIPVNNIDGMMTYYRNGKTLESVFDGVGYYRLVNDYYNGGKTFMIPYLKRFAPENMEEAKKTYRQKIHIFEGMLNLIKNNYESMYNYVARRYDIDEFNNIIEKKLSASESVFEKNNIFDSIENTLYENGTLYLDTDIYNAITPGQGQQYSIEHDKKTGLIKIVRYAKSYPNSNDRTKFEIVKKDVFVNSDDKTLDKDEAIAALKFFGINVNKGNIAYLINKYQDDKSGENSIQMNIVGMFAALKMHAYIEIEERVIETRIAGGSTEESYHVKLNKLKDNAYTREMDRISDGLYSLMKKQRKGKVKANTIRTIEGTEIQMKVPSPMDHYGFLNILGEATRYNNSLTEVSAGYDVAGNVVFNFLRSSYLQDFIMKSVEDIDVSHNDVMIAKVEKELMSDNPGVNGFDQLQSPLLFLDAHDKLTYNNSVLQKYILVDAVADIDGMTYEENGVKFEKLSDKDKFKIFYGMTKNKMIQGGIIKGYALFDTLSDSSHYPIMEFVFQRGGDSHSKQGLVHVQTRDKSSKETVLKDVSLNPGIIIENLILIQRYYDALAKRSQKNWDKYAKGKKKVRRDSPEGEKLTFNSIEYRDYVIKEETEGDAKVAYVYPGRTITQEGNPVKGLNLFLKDKKKNPISVDELFSQFDAVNARFKPYLEGLGVVLKESGFMLPSNDVELFEDFKISDKLREQQKIDGQTIGQYREKYVNKLQEINEKIDELDKESEQAKELKAEKKRIKEKYESNLKLINEEIANNNFSQDGRLHPVLEAIFWNNYLVNEAMSQILKGTIYEYKNINDYIKRAYGLVAPGDSISVSEKFNHMGPYARAIIVEDIKGSEKLFSENSEKLTDSFTLNSILRDYMMWKDSGYTSVDIAPHGTKKTVNSYYDIKSGSRVYIKHNEFPSTPLMLRNSKYYQDMNKMMLGDKIWSEIEPIIMAKEGIDYKKLHEKLDEILDRFKTVEGMKERGKIADMVIHKSGFKTGLTRVNKLEPLRKFKTDKDGNLLTDKDGNSIPEEVSFDNVDIPMDLNSDDKVVWIKNTTLRFQTLQRQNPFGGTTFLPVQLLHTLSAFDHNSNSAEKLNDILVAHTREFTRKVYSSEKAEIIKWIRDNATRRSAGMLYQGKNYDLLIDYKNIDLNILRKLVIQMFLNESQENLRFEVPGAFHVQAPSSVGIKHVVNADGVSTRPVLASDIGDDNDSKGGYEQLQPQGFDRWDRSQWVKVTSKQELEQTREKDLRYRPAQIIAPFHHKDKFGVTTDMSLDECMTFTVDNGKGSFYLNSTSNANTKVMEDIIEENFVSIVNDERKRYDVDKMLDAFSPKMRVVLRKKYIEYLKQVNDAIPNKEQKDQENFTEKRGKGEVFTQNVDVNLLEFDSEFDVVYNKRKNLVNFLKTYFLAFNLALDGYGVRIPITESNMGSMVRIVAFSNDSDNVVYTSPLKNILDDSDYDGDAINIIYKPISSDRYFEFDDEQVKQQKFFESIYSYYYKKKNAMLMLSNLNTMSLTERADLEDTKDPLSQSHMPGMLHTTLVMDRIIFAGNTLVGHFAKMNSFIHNMFAVPQSQREEMFANSKLLSKNQGIYSTINFITKMTQAATINAGTGGALGRVNINEITSPLISGLLYMGFDNIKNEDTEQEADVETNIINILTSNFVKAATKKVMKANSIKSQTKINLSSYLKLDEGSELYTPEEIKTYKAELEGLKLDITADTLKRAALYGEQLRRLGEFYSLESKTGSDAFDIVNKVRNLQEYLGEDIYIFINSNSREKNKSVEDQINYLKLLAKNKDITAEKLNNERIIRSAFNLADLVIKTSRVMGYMELLKKSEEAIKDIFIVDNIFEDVSEKIKEKTNANMIFGEKKNETIMDEIWKYVIGMYFEKSNFRSVTIGEPEVNDQGNDVSFMATEVGMRSFNLSTPQDRVTYAMVFPNYLEQLKLKYPGNKFIKLLSKKKAADGQMILEIKRTSTIEPQERVSIKQDFLRLSNKDQKLFEIYNALINGIGNKAGSLFNVTSNNLEKDISKFLSWYKPNMIDIDHVADSIIMRRPELISVGINPNYDDVEHMPFMGDSKKKNENRPKPLYKIDKKGMKQRPRIFKLVDGQYKPIINPYWTQVNTYSTTENLNDIPKATPLKTKDIFTIIKEGELYSRYDDFYTPIYQKFGRAISNMDSTRFMFHPYSGGEAMLPNGMIVNVKLDINNEGFLTYTKKKEEIKESKIDKRSSRMALGIIATIINRIKRALPNLRVELVDNDTVHNPSRGSIAYIYNGVLYINTDLIQHDTPVHELSHIVTMVMKSINHPSYQALRNHAMMLIEQDTEEIKKIREHYGYLSTEDFIDEVISNIAGWRSEEMLKEQVQSWGTSFGKSLFKWEAIKGAIQRLWRGFVSLVNGSYRIRAKSRLNEAINATTISGLARQILDIMSKGDVLSDITTDELSALQYGTIVYSKIQENEIENAEMMFNKLFYVEDNQQLRKDILLSDFKSATRKNNNVVPAWMDPKETKNPTDEQLSKLVDDFIDRKKNIGGKVTYWLNANKGREGELDTFNYEGTPKALYDPNVEKKLKGFLNHTRHTRYYRYSELQKNPRYKHLFSSDLSFGDFDPIIAIEYDTKDEIKVSIYDITTEGLEDLAYSAAKANMFANSLSNKEASIHGINMLNRQSDFRKLFVAMLATRLSNIKGVVVNETKIAQLTTKNLNAEMVDMVLMNRQLLNIGMYAPAMNLFSREMQYYFDSKNIKNTRQNYFSSLEQFYESEKDVKFSYYALKMIRGEEYTTMKKILFATKRLRKLQGEIPYSRISNTTYDNDQLTEMRLLMEYIRQLRELPTVDNIKNPNDPFSHITAYFVDTGSIGNEYVQSTRRMVLNADMKAVNMYNQYMHDLKKDKGVFEFFEKRFKGMSKYVFNKSKGMFDDLMVKAEDMDGNMVNTGFIYWTTDPKEDEMWAGKAQQLIDEKVLTQEMLDMGRQIVETIEKLLVYNIMQQRIMEGDSFLKSATGDYNESDARKELLNNSGYRRGMIPVMNKTTGELWAEGSFKDAFKKKTLEITDMHMLYEEATSGNYRESSNMNVLRDLFIWQFGIGKGERNKDWGYEERTNRILGLERVKTTDGIKYKRLKDANGVPIPLNDEMSYDLEKIMNYFAMTTVRNAIMETEVLPVINAIKIVSLAESINSDADNKMVLTFIDEYRLTAIEGSGHKVKGEIGVNVQNAFNIGMATASALVMPLNINIPVLSLVANGATAWVEGLTETIGRTWGADRGYYGAGNLAKATALFFNPKHYRKITQLANMMHLISMSSHELINLSPHQKTKKSFFTTFHQNWMNWATDKFARCVVMTAQMIEDGSYDAYTFDEESGEVLYDPKMDKRMGWNGSDFSEEGKARMKYVQETHAMDGYPVREGDYMYMGYTMEESRLFKRLSDQYIIGAYDHKTQSLIGNYLVGRMFLMFKRYMVTRINNAVGKYNEGLNEGGKLKMVKDENGEYIPQWERIAVEGYVRTIFRHLKTIALSQSFDSLKNLKPYEKYNITKAGVNLAMVTFMWLLYKMLVDDPKDDDDDKDPVAEIRLVKNFQFAYQSLLLIPMVVEMFSQPFALVDILMRFWKHPFGQFNVTNIPFGSQVQTIAEPILYDSTVYDETGKAFEW